LFHEKAMKEKDNLIWGKGVKTELLKELQAPSGAG
jgi:hypothetical protein